MNLFNDIFGADLDRLAECITAIHKAGLSTGEYTQAGVNQNCGNVWVWDEHWSGCVACSIGFDVSWYHSCPECGQEHEFDTYEELTDYVERYEGNCKACKPKYVAGFNMPGYMPDSEPSEFDTAEEALDYIKGEISTANDDEGLGLSEDEIEALEADKRGEFGATFGKYHYFVTIEG